MMVPWVLVALLPAVLGQPNPLYTVSRPLQIDGIPLDRVLIPPSNPIQHNAAWRGPRLAPDEPPLQARTVYNLWRAPPAGGGATTRVNIAADNANITDTRGMRILFPSPASAGGVVAGSTIDQIAAYWEVKLEAPYLEVDPYNCPGFGAAQLNAGGSFQGSCRCNVPDGSKRFAYFNGATTVLREFGQTALPAPQTPATLTLERQVDAATAGPTIGMNIILNPNTYFAHPPFPNQHPFMRTYRRICMRQVSAATPALPTTTAAQNPWLDTNLMYAVVHGCDIGNTATSSCTNQALQPNLAVSNTRALNDASVIGLLGGFFDKQNEPVVPPQQMGVSTAGPPGRSLAPLPPVEFFGETEQMRLARVARTTCCGARAAVGATPQLFGVCIARGREECCGRKPYTVATQKCCSKTFSRIENRDTPCPCNSINVGGDCQTFGANTLTGTTDFTGLTDAANPTYQCCFQTKYTAFETAALPATAAPTLRKQGWCYDTASVFRCCDDGNLYDPGSSQCCRVNGLQSLNTPCPCGADLHCGNGARCCVQSFPPPAEVGQGAAQCDPLANFPVGTAPFQAQRCFGNCYDVSYQMCCNGAVCSNQYDRCCNATCCNKYTSSCTLGYRPGSVGFGGGVNNNNYRVPFEACSSKENLTARKAFFVWVLPAILTLATLLALAVLAAVARRASEPVFEVTERFLLFFAVLTVVLSIPFFFSPLYKYGLVAVVIGLVAMATAVARNKWLSLVLVFLALFLSMYLLEPFNGNPWFAITGGVLPTQQLGGAVGSTPPFSGLWESVIRLDDDNSACMEFYDYFMWDNAVRDFERFDNPSVMSFGYCSRAWIAALAVIAGLLVGAALLVFLLSIFSFAKWLFYRAGDDIIEMEVRQAGDDAYSNYGSGYDQ